MHVAHAHRLNTHTHKYIHERALKKSEMKFMKPMFLNINDMVELSIQREIDSKAYQTVCMCIIIIYVWIVSGGSGRCRPDHYQYKFV